MSFASQSVRLCPDEEWTDVASYFGPVFSKWCNGRQSGGYLFAVENFGGLRQARATALCGVFLCGFSCGSLIALLVGWGHGYRWVPGMQSYRSANNLDPAALAEMEWEIRRARLPMEVNKAVESWMLHLTTDRKSTFEYALSRAGLYSNMIRTKLRERGMPEDLLYLALIESDFYTDARSRVLATGMWQFMEPTARRYGLRIDAFVDERYDPVRSTDAAVDHLSDLYQEYGSWYLAAAAYNAGSIRVSDALQRYTDGHVGDDGLYWAIVDHLPSETANYVPKLLAATHLARSAAAYDLDVTLLDAYEYDFVWSPGGVDLGEVAHSLGVAAEQMYDLNPQLIRQATPPDEIYPLRVPVGMASQVVAALAWPNHGTRLADD